MDSHRFSACPFWDRLASFWHNNHLYLLFRCYSGESDARAMGDIPVLESCRFGWTGWVARFKPMISVFDPSTGLLCQDLYYKSGLAMITDKAWDEALTWAYGYNPNKEEDDDYTA